MRYLWSHFIVSWMIDELFVEVQIEQNTKSRRLWGNEEWECVEEEKNELTRLEACWHTWQSKMCWPQRLQFPFSTSITAKDCTGARNQALYRQGCGRGVYTASWNEGTKEWGWGASWRVPEGAWCLCFPMVLITDKYQSARINTPEISSASFPLVLHPAACISFPLLLLHNSSWW